MTADEPAKSMKTFIGEFAANIGVSSATLYGHLQDMYRQNLLPRRRGRGPGSGVELTPENLAIFLILYMTTRRPVEAVEMNEAVRRYVAERVGA